MRKKSSKTFIPYIFAFMLISLIVSHARSNNGNVLGRSYPPPIADISSKAGGTIQTEGVTLIVKEGTFDEEVYFRVDTTTRENPISVDGLWQVSDIWEARVKNMSNNDQVSEFAAHNNYILSFPYTSRFLTTDQGVTISPISLKIIRGETINGPWTVLANSVVDGTNKTVSVLTNRGGFFMIAGGYYAPTKAQPQNISLSKSTGKTVVLKENEIVITLAPTQEYKIPTPKEKLPSKSEIPASGTTDTANESDFLSTFFSVIRSFFNSFLS